MKYRLCSIVALLLLFSCTIIPAYAGVLLLSGDSNIGNPIDGSSSAPVVAGNATFMANILGSGTNVLIQQGYFCGSSCATSVDAINTYYNGLPGVTSNITTNSSIGSAQVSGVDLFIAALPSGAATGSPEITALSQMLSSGGTVLLMGENYQHFSSQDSVINAVLGYLGSGMSLGTASIGSGFNSATILPNALTAGVSQFDYAYTDSISGGTALFATGPTGPTFLAEEGVSTVPDPTTIALVGLGLLGLGFRRRKRAS